MQFMEIEKKRIILDENENDDFNQIIYFVFFRKLINITDRV